MATATHALGLRAIAARNPALPQTLILIAAFLSFVFSAVLWFFVDRDAGLFVSIWVPSILGLGAFLQRVRRGAKP